MILIVVTFIVTSVSANAQITVSKKNISINDSITVYFNPKLGNKSLYGLDPLYIHTGLITKNSENKTDWQYVPMQWCDNSEKYKLTRVNDTCYYFGINIKKFYNLPDDEIVYSIGLLFRNSDFTCKGQTEEYEDIFIDLIQNGYDFKSYSFSNNQLTINTDYFAYTVDLFENNLIKIDFHKNDKLSVSQKMSVFDEPQNIKFNINNFDSNLIIQNKDFITIVKKKPVSFTFVKEADTIIKNLRINNLFGWHYEFDSASKIYGGGSNNQNIDRNNTFILLYNRSYYGYTSKIRYSNWNIPFFVSTDLFSLYFDSPSKTNIDLGKQSKGIAEYYSSSSPNAVYIKIGHSCEELVTDFNSHVGRSSLPAYWVLGFIQSNYGYWNQFDITKRLPLYKQYKIPCEAIMIDYFWSGGKERMGDFDWDYDSNYPRPFELLDTIRSYNMKTLLISHVYVTEGSKNFQKIYEQNLLTTNNDGTPYIIEGYWKFKVGLFDLFNPSSKEVLWNLYKARYNEGITGFWCDLSEPEVHPEDMYHYGGYKANEIHNIFPYIWSELLFNKFTDYRPTERPVHFFRGGFTGMQKFGTLIWTADVQCSFDGLRTQIPIMLGLGLCGMTMVGSDAGGFAADRKNSLLYTRWIQFAAFSPILRPHSNNIQPPEPFYHDEPYLSICRNYIELRYRLIPYIYTLCYDATTTGRPLVMQMDYFDIQNKFLQDNNSQYYFGKDFIVAPILDSINTREVIIPKGIWYEFKNNKRYIGEQKINVNYDINDIPIFVRAGAIIPTTYSVLSTELFKYDYYKFLCYADSAISKSEGKMYVDNGRNPKAIEQKAYELITVKMKNETDKLTFELKKEGNGFIEFSDAAFEMQVFNTKRFNTVFLNNTLLPTYHSYNEMETSDSGVYYNVQENILHIKYPWNHQENNLIECIRSTNVIDQENILIYPNPTNGKLTINLSEIEFPLNSIEINLFSENGEKILSYSFNEQKIIELDFTKHKLSFGVYFIEIKIADKIIKYKIIYER